MVSVSVQCLSHKRSYQSLSNCFMKYPMLKSPITVSKIEDCFVSIIEAILAGGEQVKGSASKIK